MPYFKMDNLPARERHRLLDEFYASTGRIKNKKESRLIFRDLLTEHEIGNLMRRVDVAIMLMAGCTIEDIMDLLGVGRNKIRNVQRKLKSKKWGEGYLMLIERVVSQRKKKKVRLRMRELHEARMGERPDIEAYKRKYKGSALVFNIIDDLSDRIIIKKEERSRAKNRKQATKEDYKRFKSKD